MKIDDNIVKIFGEMYNISMVKHMNKTLWENKEQVINEYTFRTSRGGPIGYGYGLVEQLTINDTRYTLPCIVKKANVYDCMYYTSNYLMPMQRAIIKIFVNGKLKNTEYMENHSEDRSDTFSMVIKFSLRPSEANNGVFLIRTRTNYERISDGSYYM